MKSFGTILGGLVALALLTAMFIGGLDKLNQNELDRQAKIVLKEPNKYIVGELTNIDDGEQIYANVEIDGAIGTYAENDHVRIVVLERPAYFGTNKSEARDLNKSRIVGNWIGRKSKEGFKGLIDGLTD